MPSTILTPSGWNSPEAIRRQVSGMVCGPAADWGSWSRPLIRQILPSQLLTTALRPSGVKSKPVSRIRQNQGFSAGNVKTSTASGPRSEPIWAWLVKTSGQRGGPPRVYFARCSSGRSTTTASARLRACPSSATSANQRVKRHG